MNRILAMLVLTALMVLGLGRVCPAADASLKSDAGEPSLKVSSKPELETGEDSQAPSDPDEIKENIDDSQV